MAHYNQEWDDLGRNIQDIVDRAVNSHDYQKLAQTIRQIVDKAVDLGSEAVRKAGAARPASAGNQEVKRPAATERKNLPVLYGNTNKKTTVGILKIIGGSLLSCCTFSSILIRGIFHLLFSTGRFLNFSVLVMLVGMGTGVGLLCSGIKTLGRVARFKTYRKTLGEKTHCALEKLARSAGKNVKFVRKEVRKMIDEGFFLEGHLDKEETCLITSDETYRNFEQSRLLLEERLRQEAADKKAQETASKATATAAPRDPQVQEVLDRGNAFIAQIRKCNDDIPGEEISAKISRMEMIIRRIFERAEAHPEIVPDLKKLMDYYLPMTVKLLNAYAEMDAQPIQGETIMSSKREIEATLDTLNLAFEKLLDSVFKDTALDVSSDISVLNTLLAQEGLTEDELTKIKKQQNV